MLPNKSAYQWYLISPSWHERREWILKRATYICEKCQKRPATQVHHLTYARVFNELPSDLVALCRQCHAEIHWRQPANDNQQQFSFDFPTAPGGLESGGDKWRNGGRWRPSDAMTTEADFLRANAYHEGGHAIVGWAGQVTIRDDRPGEHAMIAGAESLPLIDRVALNNAGRQAEEMFEHLLPSWASGGDRLDTLNLLAANDIRETSEASRWIADGCARARELLRKHEREVHRLAARLIEFRHMDAEEFKSFMEGVER